MDRRKFLGSSIGAATLVVELPQNASAQRKQSAQTPQTLRLAGKTLSQLKNQYRQELFIDFLPFMEKHVIDHQLGGFMCNVDHLGRQVNQNKLSWFEGRGIWVYAFLYNNLAKEQKYLDVARRSLEFILKIKPSGEELWPKEITREGKALTSADGEIYGDLFIAEGLAEYSKATGDRSHWDMARELVLKCVRLYDREDYRPTIGQTYLGPSAPRFSGARIQGVWMVLIRVVTQMLQMHPDAELERIAQRAVDAIVKHHYNPEFQLINELLNHDLSRPQNDYAQLVYTGHSIETLWMFMLEAQRRRDQKLFKTFAEWFQRHVEVAWDDVYGGVFRNLQNVDKNTWILDKVLWAQEEVLIGCMMLIERDNSSWAKEMYERMYRYVRERFSLKRDGSPLWMYASDRRVTYEAFSRMPKRVEHYHHPRYLMLNLLSLERMTRRRGGL